MMMKIYGNFTIIPERVTGIPDSILEQNRTPKELGNWFRIDVEGAELEVLKGALLTYCLPVKILRS